MLTGFVHIDLHVLYICVDTRMFIANQIRTFLSVFYVIPIVPLTLKVGVPARQADGQAGGQSMPAIYQVAW